MLFCTQRGYDRKFTYECYAVCNEKLQKGDKIVDLKARAKKLKTDIPAILLALKDNDCESVWYYCCGVCTITH